MGREGIEPSDFDAEDNVIMATEYEQGAWDFMEKINEILDIKILAVLNNTDRITSPNGEAWFDKELNMSLAQFKFLMLEIFPTMEKNE